MPKSLESLQARLGHEFTRIELLKQATMHSSYSNETGARNHHLLCNERLEFLGDSVLSVVSSDYLYRRYPDIPEGDLTRMRASVVCEEALASYAEKIDLGDYLLLGKGEANSGGAKKPAILADAFEATLAAIYLDSGGWQGIEAVARFLEPFLEEALREVPESGCHADYKSHLQEFLQKDGGHPEYRLVEESGPDHNKTFTAEVYLDSNRIGRGVGHSKKAAEQEAARNALLLFGEDV